MEHTHSMTCKDLLANLSDYIDGDLSDEACQELRQHMAGCERCRVVFDTTTKTIYLYHDDAQNADLEPDVRERLFEALNLDDLLKPKP